METPQRRHDAGLRDIETGSPRSWWLVAPALGLYAATFLIPVGLLLVLSFARFEASVIHFDFDLGNYRHILTDGITLKVFWRTVVIAAEITVSCLVLGYPVAAFMRSSGPRLQLLLLFLIVSPLLTSIIVRNVAWILILGRNGMVNQTLASLGLIEAPFKFMFTEFAVVLAVTHVYLSFMVLPIYASLRAINPSVEEGAASLGAPPTRVFWHVTLPLSLPGVAAGCTLVFILSMGIYLTPALMGGNFVITLPMMVTDLVRNQYNWPAASAAAIMLLTAVLTMVALSGWLQRLSKAKA